jgi:MerR family mercuric resistance operon transcriptional regulator
MNPAQERLTIGACAAAAGGVNVETARYFQRKGLLTEPDKPGGGIRRYGQADVARVKFIKAARNAWDLASTRSRAWPRPWRG